MNKRFFRTRLYLWIAALLHIAQVYLICSGMIYRTQEVREAIFGYFPKLIYVDHGAAAVIACAAILQIIASAGIGKGKRAATIMARLAYILLIVSQVGYGIGRYILTQLTPMTCSVLLQTVLYTALLIGYCGAARGGRNEQEQNTVCGNTVLQGAGSASGDGTRTESENDGTDPQRDDLAEEPGHVCE